MTRNATQAPRSRRPASKRPAPQPAFTNVAAWVEGYFVPMYRRPLGGEYRWCAQWWAHGEAISRLTALWQSWEALRWQPGTGIATWYASYLDPQLPALLGPRGPFYQCTETEHIDGHQAITDAAPPGLWAATPADEPDDASPGEVPPAGEPPPAYPQTTDHNRARRERRTR